MIFNTFNKRYIKVICDVYRKEYESTMDSLKTMPEDLFQNLRRMDNSQITELANVITAYDLIGAELEAALKSGVIPFHMQPMLAKKVLCALHRTDISSIFDFLCHDKYYDGMYMPVWSINAEDIAKLCREYVEDIMPEDVEKFYERIFKELKEIPDDDKDIKRIETLSHLILNTEIPVEMALKLNACEGNVLKFIFDVYDQANSDVIDSFGKFLSVVALYAK